MENFEIIKENIIKTIKNKIEINTLELLKTDPTSNEYNNILTSLELLKLELNELNKMNELNINTKIKELNKTKEKYSFLTNLSSKEINTIQNIIYNYKKNINYDLTQSTSFPEILTDFENELLLNGINYLKFDNSSEIEKSIKILKQKTYEFKRNKIEFKKLLKNFDGLNYTLLKQDIENGKMPSIERLNQLTDLGSDSLINAIIEKYKQKLALRKEIFITKTKRDEKEKAINDRINKYLNDLIKNIDFYIRSTYLQYKQKLNLNIDEHKIDETEKLYSQIIYQLEKKDLEAKKIITKYQTVYMLFAGLERTIQKELSKMGIDIEKLNKEQNIDIYKLDRNYLYEIYSQIRLNENIIINKELNDYQENTPKLTKNTEEQ